MCVSYQGYVDTDKRNGQVFRQEGFGVAFSKTHATCLIWHSIFPLRHEISPDLAS